MHGSWLHVYLGDGGVDEPYAHLRRELGDVLARLGWHPGHPADCTPGLSLSVGGAARWVSIKAEQTGAGGLDHALLGQTLSRAFVVVVVDCGARSLLMQLYRDGVLVDRVAMGRVVVACEPAWGPLGPGAGDPSRWVDFLGTRRNASRLELCWASGGDTDQVLRDTAAIVGWTFSTGDLETQSSPAGSAVEHYCGVVDAATNPIEG